VKILHFDFFGSSSLFYDLVEKLGPEIIQLEIEAHKKNLSDPLDISKVLAACPNIEFFTAMGNLSFKPSSIDLTPQHFVNYKK